mgnify:CR=1 FL=1
MEKHIILSTVKSLLESYADSVWGADFCENRESLTHDAILELLVSDSIQAINFIVLLEDEFEIEFPDEVISMDFFESVEFVANAIYEQIRQ